MKPYALQWFPLLGLLLLLGVAVAPCINAECQENDNKNNSQNNDYPDYRIVRIFIRHGTVFVTIENYGAEYTDPIDIR